VLRDPSLLVLISRWSGARERFYSSEVMNY